MIFFEKIMEKAEPSCGYSFLAEIMAQGNARHCYHNQF